MRSEGQVDHLFQGEFLLLHAHVEAVKNVGCRLARPDAERPPKTELVLEGFDDPLDAAQLTGKGVEILAHETTDIQRATYVHVHALDALAPPLFAENLKHRGFAVTPRGIDQNVLAGEGVRSQFRQLHLPAAEPSPVTAPPKTNGFCRRLPFTA